MQIQFQLKRVVYTIFSRWLTSDPHDVSTAKCTLCVNILILQASIANVQNKKNQTSAFRYCVLVLYLFLLHIADTSKYILSFDYA